MVVCEKKNRQKRKRLKKKTKKKKTKRKKKKTQKKDKKEKDQQKKKDLCWTGHDSAFMNHSITDSRKEAVHGQSGRAALST